MLVKNKKEQLDEVDGDCYRYYLLAGLSITETDSVFAITRIIPRNFSSLP